MFQAFSASAFVLAKSKLGNSFELMSVPSKLVVDKVTLTRIFSPFFTFFPKAKAISLPLNSFDLIEPFFVDVNFNGTLNCIFAKIF